MSNKRETNTNNNQQIEEGRETVPILSSSFEPLPDPDESDDYNDVLQLNDDDFLSDDYDDLAEGTTNVVSNDDLNEEYGISNEDDYNDAAIQGFDVHYHANSSNISNSGGDGSCNSLASSSGGSCGSIQDSGNTSTTSATIVTDSNNIFDDDNHDDRSNHSSKNDIMDGRMPPKKKKPAQLNMNLEEEPPSSQNNNPINEMTISDYIIGTLIVRVVAARDLKAVNTNNIGGAAGAIVGSLRDAIRHNNNNTHEHLNANNNNNRGYSKSRSSSVATSSNHTLSSSSYHSGGGGGGGGVHHEKYNSRQRRIMRGGKMARHHHHHHIHNHESSNPYATITFANQTESTSTVYDTTNPSFPRHEQAYFDVSLPVSHLAHEQQSDIDERYNLLFEKSSKLTKDQQKQQQQQQQQQIHLPPKRPILNIELTHNSNEENDDNYDIGYDYSNPPVKNAPGRSSIKRNINGYPTKSMDDGDNNNNNNNSMDDEMNFLGCASIDVSQLITGKVTYIDEWLPLLPLRNYSQKNKSTKGKKEGKNDISGQVRIICEYDMTDITPRPGDHVRFNGFVKPMDVYPIPITQILRVDDVTDDNDTLILSYRSNPEDWYCTFAAHRFMFISVERHITAIERYQDELIDIVSKLVSSPAVHVVQKSVARLPEEGILFMGLEAGRASIGLAGRWFSGGVGKVIDDIVYATNLDGKSSTLPFDEDLSMASDSNEGQSDDEDDDDEEEEEDEETDNVDEDYDDDISLELDDEEIASVNTLSDESNKSVAVVQATSSKMPCCPISGQPMKEPVVAADGHTYEKKAITRWLRTSNISPLTGQDLPHKELIPNYLLISTFGNTDA